MPPTQSVPPMTSVLPMPSAPRNAPDAPAIGSAARSEHHGDLGHRLPGGIGLIVVLVVVVCALLALLALFA